MKILAVDDDPSIRELLPLIGRRLGFSDLVTIESGERAMKTLIGTGAAFDCFLLDITMPGMSGIELCTHIRGLRDYRSAPIIMLTAMSERDYIDRSFKAGATDYAIKPFDFVELGARLLAAQDLLVARTTSIGLRPGHSIVSNADREGTDSRSSPAFCSNDNLIESEALLNCFVRPE